MTSPSTPATPGTPATAGTPAGPASNADLLDRYRHSLTGVFGAPSRVLVRGEGALVWDADGRRYTDFLAGIAVNALGHAHPALVSAVAGQLGTLGHISNLFTSVPQVRLAERLLRLADAPEGSTVFFANSGSEANEAALKLARRHGAQDPSGRRHRVLALRDAFHGRTMGALSMTYKAAYREPFEPLPAGVEFIPGGDVEALRAALDETVAALVVEPVQGESGVHGWPAGYLQAARDLTREHGALLVFDEVQSGVGRTGHWFAHQSPEVTGQDTPVVPDAMTLAKGLGGGIPIGAMVSFGARASGLLTAGQHGTTFGGNPVATAAGLAVLDAIEDEGLLEHARRVGARLAEGLRGLGFVTEVRQYGLLVGLDVAAPAGTPGPDGGLAPAMVRAGLEAGYLLNATGPDTLRLAPPLVLRPEQADALVADLPALHAAALAGAAGATTDETTAQTSEETNA
ncbi:acetylornithine transaminase [Citricoccus sp. SGAir0253]|uniref:acetylornithine transaminase n=1 Tax=Citricoccus sp. SGAir0253 TaxID=2567881 RepID=UPI0010CCE10E|nr:acetylornithine transaminase [Citricoccus sp. SGAir0253]QCU77777.1 acetylornithine transaminase [Citricoccus sp. SGAir0253]